MSQRTMEEQAALDFVTLISRGSVSRELLPADRKSWHRALRQRAREVGHGIEAGNMGRQAWAQLSYPLHSRDTAAPRFDPRAERGRARAS